nr:hypothetical protein [Tanacetum cinerariifolium]
MEDNCCARLSRFCEESTGWYRNSTRRPFTKMEFSKVQRGDPRGWILKAEKYFRYYETLDESKVEIASMYLEGDALDLFDWPDHFLLGVFISGLKEELKVEVRIHKPRNVFKAVSLALVFEAKSRPASNPRTSNSFNYNKMSSYSTSSHDPGKLPATSQNASSSARFKNWESKRQNLHDKGLCFRSTNSFLGHVSKDGVAVDPKKVQAVLNWPLLRDSKEDGEAQLAFEKLKLALTTVQVLQLSNFHEPFTVECDASLTGVGAILLQSEHLIALY